MIEVPKFVAPVPQEDNHIISHAWFWPRVGQFFREKDVIVAETGESNECLLRRTQFASGVLAMLITRCRNLELRCIGYSAA
jgi:TPP-dependent 2-oxoacid decarboxylase